MVDAVHHSIGVATGLLADHADPRVIAWRTPTARGPNVVVAFREVARTGAATRDW
jgi:hypothetical protein